MHYSVQRLLLAAGRKKSFPVRTVLGGKDVFGVAGLYEQWKDAKGRPIPPARSS